MKLFVDRHDAGIQLAERLRESVGDHSGAIVLGLPRGGVPVAYEVARALHASLDVFVVRKVGVPGHQEYAMGAIASGGVRVVNRQVMQTLGISNEEFELVAARELAELERRETLFRGARALASVRGKTAVLVDDGVATGASMSAAVVAVRSLGAARIVAATPVIGSDAMAALERLADKCVALESLDEAGSVGAGYVNFEQTTDEEVQALLADQATSVS